MSKDLAVVAERLRDDLEAFRKRLRGGYPYESDAGPVGLVETALVLRSLKEASSSLLAATTSQRPWASSVPQTFPSTSSGC